MASRLSENNEDADTTEIQKNWKSRIAGCYNGITVELSMFLYIFGSMLTLVVKQDLILQKICRVNKNFSDEVCSNIRANQSEIYKKQVQISVAEYNQWESIAGHAIPIVLAVFLGPFSDKYGRKFILLLGLFGKLYYAIMLVVNAKMPTWPAEYIIYTAEIPCALTGAEVAIFSSITAYLTDITSEKQRTIRIGLLDASVLAALPTGVAMGSYLFNHVFQQQHANVYFVQVNLFIMCIIYSQQALKWQLTAEQKPLRSNSICGLFGDFFHMQNVTDSLMVLKRKRLQRKRLFIWLILIAMLLYCFQFQERDQYTFLYLSFKFNWKMHDYSHLQTFKFSMFTVSVLFGVPIMSKLLKFRDTTIVIFGLLAHLITRLFYYFANSVAWIYVGSFIYGLGPVVTTMLRTIMSKVVPSSERGRAFALFAVCENAVPLFSGFGYSLVYRATIQHHGNGVFLLSMATIMGSFLIVAYLHIAMQKLTPKKAYEMQQAAAPSDYSNEPMLHNLRLINRLENPETEAISL